MQIQNVSFSREHIHANAMIYLPCTVTIVCFTLFIFFIKSKFFTSKILFTEPCIMYAVYNSHRGKWNTRRDNKLFTLTLLKTYCTVNACRTRLYKNYYYFYLIDAGTILYVVYLVRFCYFIVNCFFCNYLTNVVTTP